MHKKERENQINDYLRLASDKKCNNLKKAEPMSCMKESYKNITNMTSL